MSSAFHNLIVTLSKVCLTCRRFSGERELRQLPEREEHLTLSVHWVTPLAILQIFLGCSSHVTVSRCELTLLKSRLPVLKLLSGNPEHSIHTLLGKCISTLKIMGTDHNV